MTVYFGAARITIDRGDNGVENFRTRRSIPLREDVTDSSGNVIREAADTDPQGRELWRAISKELRILKPLLDQMPEDTLELRIARTPHPEHPEDPERDTASIEYRPNGRFEQGNPSYHGITSEGVSQHQSLMLYGLLRSRLRNLMK